VVRSTLNVAQRKVVRSPLNVAPLKTVCSPLNVAPLKLVCSPLNVAPPKLTFSKSTPVKSKSCCDQLFSALSCRCAQMTLRMVWRTSRSFWRNRWVNCSSTLVIGVSERVNFVTCSVRWLLPCSGS